MSIWCHFYYINLVENCKQKVTYNVLFWFNADYDALRTLDADNASSIPSMSEDEINALPVHKYKVPCPETWVWVFSRTCCISSCFWVTQFVIGFVVADSIDLSWLFIIWLFFLYQQGELGAATGVIFYNLGRSGTLTSKFNYIIFSVNSFMDGN